MFVYGIRIKKKKNKNKRCPTLALKMAKNTVASQIIALKPIKYGFKFELLWYL